MEPSQHPGLKESDLRKLATCSCCGRKLMANEFNTPMFAVVKVNQLLVDVPALQRQDGLAQFMGSSYLAMHMGPNDDMAHSVSGELTFSVCFDCIVKVSIAHLLEAGKPIEVKR